MVTGGRDGATPAEVGEGIGLDYRLSGSGEVSDTAFFLLRLRR